MNKSKTICHCNIKENAALIAKILDCDINYWVFGRNLYSLVNEQRENFQVELDSYKDQFLDENDDEKRLSLKMAMGVLKRTIEAFDDVLYEMEMLSQEEK